MMLYDLSEDGDSPFRQWFDTLNPQAAAIVALAVGRLGDGKVLAILLGGGTKRRQQSDIEAAVA